MQPEAPVDPPIQRSQFILAGIIVAITAGALYVRVVHIGRLKQTAALFIGLPALLALILALTPRAKTPLGMVMKGMTIALLLAGPLLQEGFICILMASPLFYAVGLVIGLVLNNKAQRSRTRTLVLLAAFVLPQCLEGTHAALSFSRDEVVESERVVRGTPEEVAAALAAVPRFDRALPLYLRLGFPTPAEAEGSGLAVGDVRRTRFRDGMGDLTLVVTARDNGRVVFEPVADSTPIGQWLEWRQAEVTFRPDGDGRTRVTWTLRYRRRLDPAWYFGPWERYGVRLTAGYLLECLATPQSTSD